MKPLLIFGCLLLSLKAFSDDKNTSINITGNWKEVKEMNLSKQPLAFTDTIVMKFTSPTEYVWKKGDGLGMRGYYTANKKTIDLGMIAFDVQQYNHDSMTLKTEDKIYKFVRFTEASLKEDDSKAQGGARLLTKENYADVTDFNVLKGRWQNYKREGAVKDVDYSRIIKMIVIPANSQDGKKGFVYAANDAESAPSWFIDKFENSTIYCKGKDDRTLKVLKCDGTELIFDDGVYKYYCKKFDK
ncbi:hypothetical protein [Taibaiella soli]|uniref:Lipocalin-like domain-containing protein n=1 Tax=Taibaiella soli TaxID=1649169 RepID=A0A2W2AC08_9BACT|nr:hypothetical protein [Taibaiella soli]PZF72821.1 hypothetical protein DN068_10420 [Taibaiella soli]